MGSFFDLLHQWGVSFIEVMQKEVVFSTVLFGIIFVLTTLLRKRSPYLHYGLWALVLLRLILPTDLSSSFSARSLLSKFESTDYATTALQTTASSEIPVDQQTRPEVGKKERLALPSAARADLTLPSEGARWSWQAGVFLLWAVGVVAFVFIFFKRYSKYREIVKKSRRVSESTLLAIVEAWRQRFGIRRRIKLVSSEHCLSPFTLGVVRPVIYLPHAMLQKSSSNTIESVIAHELAHVKQWDDLWLKVQNVVQILYFFHPVVWLLNSQLNQTRERICDSLVLAHGTIAPQEYGKSMLSVLRLNLLGIDGLELLPGFGNHKKKFSRRIREMTRLSHARPANLVGVGALVLLMAAFLLPMADSSTPPAVDSSEQVVQLLPAVNGDSDYGYHTSAVGSKFMTFSESKIEKLFCESKLPHGLTDLQFAAIGIYDIDYRKIWVLKGVNRAGDIQFYLDTNGDNCFTDEKPLNVLKKTTKWHLEGSSEWTLSRYFKSRVYVEYDTGTDSEKGKLAVFLGYDPQKNFLEFVSSEFWVGEARFGEKSYPIALYGGLKLDWYLRASFDRQPQAATDNQIRIDLNGNNIFEEMTFFDPDCDEVVRENFYVNQPFVVNGKLYEIRSVIPNGRFLNVKIAAKAES